MNVLLVGDNSSTEESSRHGVWRQAYSLDNSYGLIWHLSQYQHFPHLVFERLYVEGLHPPREELMLQRPPHADESPNKSLGGHEQGDVQSVVQGEDVRDGDSKKVSPPVILEQRCPSHSMYCSLSVGLTGTRRSLPPIREPLGPPVAIGTAEVVALSSPQ